MSTRISSLSIRTTVPSTTSPCLKLLMSESCSARSSSIVVGSGPRSRGAGAGSSASSSSAAVGASAVSSASQLRRQRHRRGRATATSPMGDSSAAVAASSRRRARRCWQRRVGVGRARAPRRRSAGARRRRRLGVDRRRFRLGRRIGRGGRLGRHGHSAGATSWVAGAASAAGWSAGSSATAVAAAVRSGFWPVGSRRRPRAGRPRPAVLRSTVWSLLSVKSPDTTTARATPGPGSRRSAVVRGDGPRSAPFVASWRGTSSSAVCPLGPGESSTAFHAATIGRPCPNCPTWRSSPRPSTLPSRAVRSPPSTRPDRSPSAERRPSSTALVGQRARRAAAAREVPDRRASSATESSFNPMLTGRFQLAAPGTPLPTKTAFVLGVRCRARARRAMRRRWTRKATWLPADDASVEVRYRDPTQMGKVYLAPGRRRPASRRLRRRARARMPTIRR